MAIPKEFNARQRRELTNRYAWALTDKGRAAAIFAVHADKKHNPHLHISYTDRPVNFVRDDAGKLLYAELGPTVQKLTAKSRERVVAGLPPNATQHLREMWRDVANDALADNGFDIRIDNRTLLEQGIDRQAEKHRGPKSTVMQVADTPVDLPHAKSEIFLEQVMADPLEKLAADLDEHIDEPAGITPEDYVRGALDLDRNLNWLKHTHSEIDRLAEEAEISNEAAKVYRKEAFEHDRRADAHRNAADLANDLLTPLLKPNGRYRGFRFEIFGREIASRKYKRARNLDQEKQYRQHEQREAKEAADRILRHAQTLADKARELTEKAEFAARALEEQIGLYGDKETLIETTEMMNEGIQNNLSHLTPDHVYALYENGALHKDEATRAFELMGQEAYITKVELRDRQEQQEEGLSL